MNEQQAIEAIIKIFPDAIFDEDQNGQYIIYTGMTLDERNVLIPIYDL